jgi:hypothetical protein
MYYSLDSATQKWTVLMLSHMMRESGIQYILIAS